MQPTGTWKKREQALAKLFKSERTPLSGGNSKMTRSDTLHPRLFIELKYRKRFSLLRLWDQTEVLAKAEGKAPVVVIAEKNREGFFAVVPIHDGNYLRNLLAEIDPPQ